MIAAILRAQWLSLRSFRWRLRPAAAVSILTAILWYGFWSGIAFAAEEFTATPRMRSVIETGLPAGVLFIFLYWQFTPLISASMGASLDLKKLLIYPVPHRDLFLIEVLLRLTTCLEMLLVLAGITTGLFRNPLLGGMGAVPRLLGALLVFVILNLLLAAGARSLLERILLQKRLREILMLALVMVAALPQLLATVGTPAGPWKFALLQASRLFWPWGAFSRLALGQGVFLPGMVLLGWTAAALLFGLRQFERGLRFDAAETAAVRGPRAAWRDRVYTIPGLFLPDPLAAIVEKEVRSLARTPRFRVVFLMGFSFGLLIWMPMKLRHSATASMFSEHFLTVVSAYALILLGQVSYMNAFGFDGAAAQVYFSLPVGISWFLGGKNVAAGIFTLLEIILLTIVCLLLRVEITAAAAIEAYAVVAVIGLYLLGIGNLASVHFPRALKAERLSNSASAGRMQALLALLYPVALLPVALAFLARYAFNSETAFYLVLGFAAAVGAVFYWIAIGSAAGAAVRRRETILAELSSGGGPVMTG